LKEIKSSLQVGGAFDVSPMLPATDSAEDRAAAVTADALLNLWYLQPALTGQYPIGVLQWIGRLSFSAFILMTKRSCGPPSILWASTTTRVSGCLMLLGQRPSGG
jgi:beta-glucosidase/6-phospho-beta-glucosidase/beta-galactosidase